MWWGGVIALTGGIEVIAIDNTFSEICEAKYETLIHMDGLRGQKWHLIQVSLIMLLPFLA
jgi:hypothetical protein